GLRAFHVTGLQTCALPICEKQQVSSFTKALEGTVAGLQATNGGGAPGTNADIRIRGIGSVNANSSPLYVIDGVPYSGSQVSISTDRESVGWGTKGERGGRW